MTDEDRRDLRSLAIVLVAIIIGWGFYAWMTGAAR